MTFQNISPQTAFEKLTSDDALLIDVRDLAEHNNLHIPNSSLHPLASITKQNIVNRDKALIIYCQKGLRGRKACQKLAEQDTSLMLFNIDGGIEAWQRAKLPTAQLQMTGMSLDRQIQLAIGVLLTFFTLCTLFISINFVWAIAIIGLGLIVSGVTGFCGLGRLIAMMPWNTK